MALTNTPNVIAKTGNYTVVPGDEGAFFTNRGAAGTITFTLPTNSTITSGWWAEFYTVAAQSIAVASDPADTLITHADATSDSITTAATIGQHIKVVFDGTGWAVISDPSAATTATAVTAVTIAT
jgi:hypothetical protein